MLITGGAPGRLRIRDEGQRRGDEQRHHDATRRGARRVSPSSGGRLAGSSARSRRRSTLSPLASARSKTDAMAMGMGGRAATVVVPKTDSTTTTSPQINTGARVATRAVRFRGSLSTTSVCTPQQISAMPSTPMRTPSTSGEAVTMARWMTPAPIAANASQAAHQPVHQVPPVLSRPMRALDDRPRAGKWHPSKNSARNPR